MTNQSDPNEGKNLSLPGNPRYQPKELQDIFGYDNLYRPWAIIELAKFEVMNEIGMISNEDYALLTPAIRQLILNITTSETDLIERSITHHDVNAHVQIMREIMPERLKVYLHMPFTSYDKISTGYVMQYKEAFEKVIEPKIKELIFCLAQLVDTYSDRRQIGRTHGQYALPITVGFWLANILSRVTYNYLKMKKNCDELRGKISGAVGAYNAQVALGFEKNSGRKSFEDRILGKLNLKAALVSTQILPPEQVAYFFHSALMFSASLAQLGRDGRNLMRSDIAEISEAFEEGQVGSSTMAQKRNPINFENTEGMFLRNKNEFGKIMDTLISEHQRDLVNSSPMRDFPIILVNLMCQLNTLLRPGGKDKSPFIKRITINEDAVEENLTKSLNTIMAEPIYISLQLAGYKGDAHHLVNHQLTPMSQSEGIPLIACLEKLTKTDEELNTVYQNIPNDILEVLWSPKDYIGKAAKKSHEVANWARLQIAEKVRASQSHDLGLSQNGLSK